MVLPPDDPRLLRIDLRRELIAAGHTDQSLARSLRDGVRERPRRGAYVDGHLWRSMSSEEQYAVRCRAAYRQANTDVVLSHVSALPFHDAPLWGFDLSDAHLTREDGVAGRKEAGVCQHSGRFLDGDIVEHGGHKVTSALRATLEVSMVGSAEAALVVTNHFLHAGFYDKEALAARYEASMGHWPNSLRTDLVLRLADPRIESVGESRTSYFFFRSSLPKPEPQFEVIDAGVLIARLDFALPEHGVWFEFDGKVKYQRYLRAGESVTDAVLREKARESKVSELTGWRCFRITWADLLDPVQLEGRIRAFIESVARSRKTPS